MIDYDEMTNADVLGADELAEYDRTDKYAFDAADEARIAAEADAADAAERAAAPAVVIEYDTEPYEARPDEG